MKSLIIFKEKYGPRYFDGSDKALQAKACFAVLKQRVEEKIYYDGQDLSKAIDILESGDHNSAFQFLYDHRSREYEDYEIVRVEEA